MSTLYLVNSLEMIVVLLSGLSQIVLSRKVQMFHVGKLSVFVLGF